MGVADDVVPVTYMNSSAAIKAFTGRHGGTVCTSSNARTALQWAFDQRGGLGGHGQGAVPARPAPRAATPPCATSGSALEDCVVFDPHRPNGGLTREQVQRARVILWRGHCSVHGRFSLDAVRPRAGRSPA